MTTPELPPLPSISVEGETINASGEYIALLNSDDVDAREAVRNDRERILRDRIAELEAVLAKFDERWLMDGELGFCTACGVSIEGGESHKPECWLAEARAAIDAARKA